MVELRRGPFILLFALDRQLGELLSAAMADSPLRPGDFAVTSVLRLTGPVRPTELAGLVGMRPTSLSNHLKRLGADGLVRRRPDPRDGRAVLVSLTAKGDRATVGCFPAFSQAIEAFRAALAAEGLPEGQLLETFETVSRALSAAATDVERAARQAG